MKRGVIAALPFVAAMMGCPAALHGPAQQAQAIVAAEGGRFVLDKLMGHIGESMQPVATRAVATSAFSKAKVAYVSAAVGSVCFSQVLFDSSYAEYADLAAAARSRADVVRRQRWTFEAREGFDDLAGKKWVTSPKVASQVTSVKVGDYKIVVGSKSRSNRVIDSHSLATEVRFCGALPPIVPTTRYLVATYYPDDFGAPMMFIWKLDGAPAAPSP